MGNKGKKPKNKQKNVIGYFSPESDEEFKSRHPILYWILVAFGIFALVAPLVSFIVYIILNDTELNGWVILCYVGCFIVGAGLFNIVAAFIKQYLGHLFTVGCFLVGGFLIYAGLLLMRSDYFTDEQVAFYFITLLFILFTLISYVLFRSSVYQILRGEARISRSRLRREMRGKRNFWWYEGLHRTENLGAIYRINKLFTILVTVTFATAFFFGLIKIMSIPIIILSSATQITSLIMYFYGRRRENICNYGTPIVFSRGVKEGNGSNSLLGDIVVGIITLCILYVHIRLFGSLWNINFRLL